MGDAVLLILTLLSLVLIGHGAYRCARVYGRAFWAIMGMVALACAATVLLSLAIGTNGWSSAHAGLATMVIVAAIIAMVAGITIVGNRMFRRAAAPPPRRIGRG